MQSQFAIFLNSLRKQRGLTQKQLAKNAQISVRALIYWETGHCEPRSHELEEVLNALNATPEQREQSYRLLQSPRGIKMMRTRINDHYETNASPYHIPESGDLIAALRLRQGWTRERLATELGIHTSTVGRWEHTDILPTGENLMRIFTLLRVHPCEQEALMARTLMPQSLEQDGSNDGSYEAWVQRVQAFWDRFQSGSLQLVDLHALALKRRLWLSARNAPYFQSLMGILESYYSSWLIYQDRLTEAETCAGRALQLCAADTNATGAISIALNIAASCAHIRHNNDPTQAIQLLQQWLPRIEYPPTRVALQCDLAYYLASSEDTESALTLMRRAKKQLFSSLATPESVRYYQISLARILANAGQYDRALRNLPSNQDVPEYKRLFSTLVRAEILYGACQLNEARQVVQQLYDDLKRLPGPRIQARLDLLADRL